MRALTLVLLVAYAVSVHLAILTDQPRPALIALGVLLVVVVGGRWRRLCVGVVMAAIVWRVGDAPAAAWLLYLPPLMIYLALAALFGGSLRAGRTPLVTRIATLMDGDLSPRAVAYTRSVTTAWTLFLILLACVSAVLAWWEGEAIWSLFSNFLSYLALVLFMVVEFAVRRKVLSDETPAGFVHFLRRLGRLDMRQLIGRGKP